MKVVYSRYQEDDTETFHKCVNCLCIIDPYTRLDAYEDGSVQFCSTQCEFDRYDDTDDN